MKTKILLAAFLLFGAGVNAQTGRCRHHERQRIKQGVRSSELTRAETKRLALQQKDIHHDIKEAKADGTVTNQEKKEIVQDEKQASHSIYRLKHNNRERN
jgi:tellurite resistance protein